MKSLITSDHNRGLTTCETSNVVLDQPGLQFDTYRELLRVATSVQTDKPGLWDDLAWERVSCQIKSPNFYSLTLWRRSTILFFIKFSEQFFFYYFYYSLNSFQVDVGALLPLAWPAKLQSLSLQRHQTFSRKLNHHWLLDCLTKSLSRLVEHFYHT